MPGGFESLDMCELRGLWTAVVGSVGCVGFGVRAVLGGLGQGLVRAGTRPGCVALLMARGGVKEGVSGGVRVRVRVVS